DLGADGSRGKRVTRGNGCGRAHEDAARDRSDPGQSNFVGSHSGFSHSACPFVRCSSAMNFIDNSGPKRKSPACEDSGREVGLRWLRAMDRRPKLDARAGALSADPPTPGRGYWMDVIRSRAFEFVEKVGTLPDAASVLDAMGRVLGQHGFDYF